MTTAEGFAPAKINLTLHVTGQRADGYHLLDSLVVFADLGDRLRYRAGPELKLRVTGPFADGVPDDRRNLVWRAAEICGWSGEIVLEKTLPHGAGIGGGSADAACVLRDLGEKTTAAQAAALGADVPVCLSPLPQRMSGIGDVLAPAGDVPPLDLVLVNPGLHVPTPQVFAALREKANRAMDWPAPTEDKSAFLDWLGAQRNDLEAPALACAPGIATVLSELATDAGLVRMSGSGSTCFGIFADTDAARAASRRLASAHPDWWVRTCRTFSQADA